MNSIKYIPGEGSLRAKVAFVGEAPGAAEEADNRPFAGRSGTILDSMINYLGLHRDDVYITNAVKVRPPFNRQPTDEEIESWRPLLFSELWFAAHKKVVVVALGQVAAKALMGSEFISLKVNRGQHLTDIPQIGNLFITYHPAYLLRSPSKKLVAGEDLDLIKDFLNKE